MDGILLVDKPEGITSTEAVRRTKKTLKANKTGHAGTLDPFASGLLICCINKATKLFDMFQGVSKTYRGTLWLGVRTDTQDPEGAVVARADVPAFAKYEIEKVFNRFVGVIEQVPPMFSALKHRGVPLYKLARLGQGVVKPPRKVKIDSLDILRIDLPQVEFEVCCSKGTYVRALASDIGDSLGCGGHLSKLRRLACGQYVVEAAVKADDLTPDNVEFIREKIIPMSEFV
ncbi:MAG: tRNA pseudouridine(55) synthase TruB [Pseudomonadota bacterium]